jgi:WD40 repeat protein
MEIPATSGPDGQIYVAHISPDATTVATALTNGDVWLWNVSTGLKDGNSLLHEGRVSNLAFTPDSTMLLTGCIRLPGTEPRFEDALDAGSDFDRAEVTAKAAGFVRLWSMSSRKPTYWDWQPVPVTFVGVSPDDEGRRLFYGGTRLDIWDRKEKRKAVPSIELPDNGLWGAFDAAGKYLLVVQMSGKVELYPLPRTGQQRQAVHRLPPQGWVADAGFRGDNKSLFTLNQDGTVRTWLIPTTTHAGKEFEHPSSILSVSFGPESRTFVTGCQDGAVYLWTTDDSTACKQKFTSRPWPGLNVHPESSTGLRGSAVLAIQQRR